MYQIDFSSGKPIYVQIVEQTERFILSEAYTVGEKLPSVRELSVKLSVNPNTVARAYNELCLKGIIVSLAGKGFFVSENAKEAITKNSAELMTELNNLVEKLQNFGIKKEEGFKEIERIYLRGEIE